MFVDLYARLKRRVEDGSLAGQMVGIVVPGDRVAALATNRILFRGGLPLAVREGGRVRFLAPLDAAGQWQAQSALLGRRAPVSLAAFRRSKE